MTSDLIAFWVSYTGYKSKERAVMKKVCECRASSGWCKHNQSRSNPNSTWSHGVLPAFESWSHGATWYNMGSHGTSWWLRQIRHVHIMVVATHVACTHHGGYDKYGTYTCQSGLHDHKRFRYQMWVFGNQVRCMVQHCQILLFPESITFCRWKPW